MRGLSWVLLRYVHGYLVQKIICSPRFNESTIWSFRFLSNCSLGSVSKEIIPTRLGIGSLKQAFLKLWVATQIQVTNSFSVGHETMTYTAILQHTSLLNINKSFKCHTRNIDSRFLFYTYLYFLRRCATSRTVRDRFLVVSLDFSVTCSFRLYHGPGVDSAPSENEYQEHSWG